MWKQITAVLFVGFVSATGALGQDAGEPIRVGFDDPVFGPAIGGLDGSDRSERSAWTVGSGIPNYTCEYFDNCPAGTALITADGNYVGCTTSCTGTCTRCDGSEWLVYLCVRYEGDSCDRAINLTKCGKKGTGICYTDPPAGLEDNNGCGCTIPGSYGTLNCTVVNCLDIAGP